MIAVKAFVAQDFIASMPIVIVIKSINDGYGLAVPKFIRRGVAVYLLLNACKEIEFDDFPAIGGIGKLESENFGIVFGLLQTVANWRFVRFGFDDCQCQVATIAEQVIGTFAFTPFGGAARENDATVRKAALFRDFKRAITPTSRLNSWCHVLAAGIGFAELERIWLAVYRHVVPC